MTDMVEVTNSELSTYRDCPYKHGLVYIDRLRPRRDEPKLSIGRIVHDALAKGIRARFAGESWSVSHLGDDLEDAEMIAFMVEHYFEVRARDFEEFELVEVERAFSVPLAHGVTFSGVRDAVLYDRKRNALVLQEHKTCSGNPRDIERRVMRDPQAAGYIFALRHQMRHGGLRLSSGEPVPPDAEVGRVHYNALRKAMPRQPRINKNGLVSHAAIDTKWQLYDQALSQQVIARRLEVTGKQMARLEELQAQGDRYFARIDHFLIDDDLDRWHSESVINAERIRSSRRAPELRTRNQGHCTMPWSMQCAYDVLCDNPSSPELRGIYDVVDEPHMEIVEAKEEHARQD